MNPSSIALCTTTFYPKWIEGEMTIQELLESGDRAFAEHKTRGDLALQTAIAALREGLKLVLVDGAAGSAFQEKLRKEGIPFHQETGRGMSASRRQAFDVAYADQAVEAVMWIEPEKIKMIDEVERCTEPVLSGEVAISIPSRTIAGFDSMPHYQRVSEQKANRLFNEKLRGAGLLSEEEMLDLYFGPRVYSAIDRYREKMHTILQRQYVFSKKDSVPFHKAVNPGAYSEATFFPPVAALHEGLPVKSVPTRFTYPTKQVVLEEHKPFMEGENGYETKRKTQNVGILTELVHYLRSIGRLEGPESRLKAKTPAAS